MCLGIPGQVVEISDAAQLRATVDVQGVRREVSVALIGVGEPDGARAGDWVIVHVGFAMERIDEAQARHTLDELDALGDMYAEMEGLDELVSSRGDVLAGEPRPREGREDGDVGGLHGEPVQQGTDGEGRAQQLAERQPVVGEQPVVDR
jgi:hydrogenase expression/formation protein HypC